MCLLLYKDQTEYAAQIGDLIAMFFNTPELTDAVNEVLAWETTPQVAKAFLDNLPSEWTVENLKESFNKAKEESGVKGKQLFMGLRVAATHHTSGPDLMSSLYLMGETAVRKRLEDYVA